MAGTGRPVSLRYASLEARLVAGVLDLVLLASFFLLFLAAAGLVLLLTGDFGDVDPPDSAFYAAIAIILAYLPFAALYFVLLWTWRGQTVGQMAMHIRVARRHGDQVELAAAGLRFLGCLLATAPLFLGFLVALLDAERRGLHDRLADTVVLELP